MGRGSAPAAALGTPDLKNTASLFQLKGPLASPVFKPDWVMSPTQGPGLAAAVFQREPGTWCSQQCDSVAWPTHQVPPTA